jgi:hypothetical protein
MLTALPITLLRRRYTNTKIAIESLSTAFANTNAVQALFLPLLLMFVVWYIRKRCVISSSSYLPLVLQEM